MKANVGSADRAIRITVGILILSAVFLLEDSARWFGLLGIVPLATGLMSWCPAYGLLGTNTCGTPTKGA
jgi:hypothetical protein